MMKIQRQYVERVQSAGSVAELLPLVQNAIELEHATIPLYLSSYFTLKPGTNTEVARIIRSVVIQEMLHFSITANLLIALGGSPAINTRSFVPDYPGGLPMGIGDGLQLHLRKCSINQVRDVFMAIEEPEHPIDIPVPPEGRMLLAAAIQPEFETIGAFYQYLAKKIEELGSQITWDTDNQVVATQWFPDPNDMFEINSVDSAVRAINVIVNQGEGTSTDPFSIDADCAPAHYYRFEEIVKGRKLIHKPGATPPYEFGGDPVVLDTANVWDMDDDPKIAKYREGSRSRRVATQFSYSYTRLLNSLHSAFNGDPAQIDHAMGVMYELRVLAQQALSTPAEWTDRHRTETRQTGLSFQYQTLND